MVQNAFSHPIDMNIISLMESSNNPKAVGPTGDIGKYQISPGLLSDYNRLHKTKYSPTDLTDETINRRIADWQLERLWARFQTVDLVLIGYNCGPKCARNFKSIAKLPRKTRHYLLRYHLERTKDLVHSVKRKGIK